MHGTEKTCLKRWKEQRVERRRVRDTAKRHRLNTEHRTVITILVIPAKIPGRERAGLWSHAGGAVICFSPRLRFQTAADLFIPASLSMSIIDHKKRAIWRDVWSYLYLKFLLFFVIRRCISSQPSTQSHPYGEIFLQTALGRLGED